MYNDLLAVEYIQMFPKGVPGMRMNVCCAVICAVAILSTVGYSTANAATPEIRKRGHISPVTSL